MKDNKKVMDELLARNVSNSATCSQGSVADEEDLEVEVDTDKEEGTEDDVDDEGEESSDTEDMPFPLKSMDILNKIETKIRRDTSSTSRLVLEFYLYVINL